MSFHKLAPYMRGVAGSTAGSRNAPEFRPALVHMNPVQAPPSPDDVQLLSFSIQYALTRPDQRAHVTDAPLPDPGTAASCGGASGASTPVTTVVLHSFMG